MMTMTEIRNRAADLIETEGWIQGADHRPLPGAGRGGCSMNAPYYLGLRAAGALAQAAEYPLDVVVWRPGDEPDDPSPFTYRGSQSGYLMLEAPVVAGIHYVSMRIPMGEFAWMRRDIWDRVIESRGVGRSPQ